MIDMEQEYNLSNPSAAEEERIIQDKINEESELYKRWEAEQYRLWEEECYKEWEEEQYRLYEEELCKKELLKSELEDN